MKLYVYAILLVAVLASVAGLGAYVHHKWYGAGDAHGLADCARRVAQLDGKSSDACGTAIAALKGKYVQAYDDALRQAQDAQRAADAQALKDAQDRAAKAEQQVAQIAAEKHAVEQSAATFRKRLNEARKHDATAAALLDTPLPASVRAAGQG